MLYRFSRHGWVFAGVLVLVYCASLTLLSGQFIYGEGHASRPIVLVLGMYSLGWIGFALAVWLAVRDANLPVSGMLAVALLARLILLPSNLIQENDCYRYVLDGEALLNGVNPYGYSPEDMAWEAPAHFREALNSPEAQAVLSRVGYPEIPTIYPPAAQGAFALGALLTPWSWMGQRIVLLAGDIATISVLLGLLRNAALPLKRLVFYAWNPLILKEVINSVHIDGLVALGLALTILCLAKSLEKERSAGWAALAGCALAGAVLTKLYPILLAPIAAGFLWNARRKYLTALAFWFTFATVIVAAYWPFLGVGWEQLTAGLRTYAGEWRRNDGAFALLVMATPYPRACAAAIAVIATVIAAGIATRSRGKLTALVRACQVALLAWFLFLPAAYPWYAVGLLVIATLRPRPWGVVLSGVFGLYYLQFWVDYHELPAHWHAAIAAAEHGSVWIAVVVPFLAAIRGKRRPHEISTRTGDIGTAGG